VSLVVVDEDILRHLVAVAVADADADEVTPPLTPGREWTAERRNWLLDYHRTRRAGLDGPHREATWAIVCDGAPVGSVRLQATGADGELEAGIWVARSARGRRIAHEAMRELLVLANRLGATRVRADTAVDNVAAQRLMRSIGFEILTPVGGRVHAEAVVSNS